MELIYNTPSLGKDARIRVLRDTIAIEMAAEIKSSTFQKNGMLLSMTDCGDLLPVGPYDDVICDPVFNLCFNDHKKTLDYSLSGRGIKSMHLDKTDLLNILRGQHELAGTFYERLTSETFPQPKESRKYMALEMLENIANFDIYSYLDFDFVRK